MFGSAMTIYSHSSHAVQPEKDKIHEIVLR
jgi:hypothetical protein